MGRRLLAFVLVVTFLCSPTLAARGEAPAEASSRPTFTDVPADRWYAPCVELCVESGVMNGVGNHAFAPEEYLTVGECAALAARLHDVLRGGDGKLPAAPKAYGSGVFLDEQGNRVALASDVKLVLGGTGGMPVATFSEELMSALRGESRRVNQLTLVIDGASRYEGEYTPESADTLEGYRFPIKTEDPTSYFLNDLLGPCGNWGPFTPNDQWFLDACHYLAQNAGADGSTLRKGWRLPVPRSQWVELIALAVPKDMLAPINQIEALPDTDDPTVLAFYNAGLLTGTDALGSFSGGEWNVTRAEAAQLLARVLRPELRVSYTPEPMRYSLTPLTLPDGYNGFGEKFIYNFSIDEYRTFGDYIYLEDGGFTGVMKPDGSWLISPRPGV